MTALGFLGLGKMGGAIARRLIQQGQEIIAFDPDPGALQSLSSSAASGASSPREVADRAEIVISCLPNQHVCVEAALGDDGVIHGGLIRYYIETSTMGRSTAVSIADTLRGKGIEMLDAPISGAPPRAETGTLTSIVAGPGEALEQVRAVFDNYSANIFHVSSAVGGAQVAKVINNAVSVFAMLATFEGLAFAEAAGIDRKLMIDLFNSSSGATFASQVIIPRYVLSDAHGGVGRCEMFHKDFDLYIEEARNLGLKPPLADFMSEVGKRATPDVDADVAATLYQFFSSTIR